MQVGGGAPTQKLAESQLTIMCKLGGENDKEILFFIEISILCMSFTHVFLIFKYTLAVVNV